MNIYWFESKWGAAVLSAHYTAIEGHEQQTKSLMDVNGKKVSTRWRSGGDISNVATARLDGEAVSDWIGRHFDAVRASFASYPVDTGEPSELR